jgi:cytidine deaminase
LVAVRGVNLEVSLPTGTLCAERNAIGTALSNFPQLERKDILALSVLALKEGQGARLGPCGACAEWIRKVAEVNPEIRIITFKDSSMKRVFVEHMPLQ